MLGFKSAKAAEEISLGMFPSEHFHQIQEEVAVLLTVSLFIIIVIAPWRTSLRKYGENDGLKHGEPGKPPNFWMMTGRTAVMWVTVVKKVVFLVVKSGW